MEFKKIDENRFQCLLMEEDLEDNNITLDDFFRNDTDKIHNLLEVVMEEAVIPSPSIWATSPAH